MLKPILQLKQRREDETIKVEHRARLELEQAVAALQTGLRRKSDYERWSVSERERLYGELQQQGAVKYNDLMQWNAQVADIKQGLLDIKEQIMILEQARERKLRSYEEATKLRQVAQRQVIQFTALVNEEQGEALLLQERFEEREMEDVRRPKSLN